MSKNLKQIKKVLWIILVANLAVALAKIFLGMAVGSSAVLADGFHSVTDGSGNVIGLIAIAFASQPEDEEHPYGHAKIEMLGSLIIVALLAFLGFEIVKQAIDRFFNPVALSFEWTSFVVMLGTLVINGFVTVLEYREGKKLQSALLMADALHTRSDVFVTLGVITSMGLVALGLPVWVDSLMSLVVSFFIFKAAFEIYQEVGPILLDAKIVNEDEIRDILKSLTEIKELHHIRSRGTMSSITIDLHVLADDDMPLKDGHELSHRIEKTIQDAYPEKKVQVISHLEPYLIKRVLPKKETHS